MKILDVTPISTSAQMPIKKGTLQFLQDAYKECIDAILRGTIGSAYSASTYYILHGCVNSGAGTNYVISAGAIYYNGEIYLVDSATFSTSGGLNPIMTITTTQYTTNADPVTFTNGSSNNVHDIRKIVISGGTGSGNIYGVNTSTSFIKEAVAIVEQENEVRIKTKVIPIGAWDMNVDFALVPHGVADFKKIRTCKVSIINDGLSKVTDELYYGDVEIALWTEIGATDITLNLPTASFYYTNSDYNDAVMNRGYVTITYEA